MNPIMANPQAENGMTRINHENMEKLLEYPFPSPCPLKICFFIIKKTWGWQKKSDYISLTQFQKGIKTSRPTVVHWLDYLVKHQLLVKGDKLSKFGIEYSFNKDWGQWKGLDKPLKLVKPRSFSSKSPLTEPSKTPLTHNIKKETIQKKCMDISHFEKFWSIYPNKINKKKASELFLKLDVTLITAILAAVEKQKLTESWFKDGGKYVPYPTTWLSGERWNDESKQMDDDTKYRLEMEELGTPKFLSKYGEKLAMAYTKYSKI